MGTALDEMTVQTGKPLCVDRRNSCPKPYTAARVISAPQNAPPKPAPILTGRQHSSDKAMSPAGQSDKRTPVRVTRSSSLTLWLSAVCGIAAGMLSAKEGGLAGGVMLCCEGSFLSLFLSRLVYGAAFLLAEYILGYFALGEWLVWVVPLCCGMGLGASAASLFISDNSPLTVIPAAATLFAVILGARCSGEFSAQLLRVISGSRTGIVLTADAAKSYTLRFAAYLALAGAAALIDAAIKL